MQSRPRFLWSAFVTGARWFLDVTDHAARVAALVGIPVAVTITGFVVLARGWIPLVASIVAVLLVAFAEGSYQTWAGAKRAAIEAEEERDQLLEDRRRKLREAAQSLRDELAYIERRLDEAIDEKRWTFGSLPNTEWAKYKSLLAAEIPVEEYQAIHAVYLAADALGRVVASRGGTPCDREEADDSELRGALSDVAPILRQYVS